MTKMNRGARHMCEECWTLLGGRRVGVWRARAVRHVVGQPVKVAFDAAWVLAREERHGDVIGFLHTHPTPSLLPSGRDVRTMRAWCSAFGKPLICLIAHGERVAGYRFEDNANYVILADVRPLGRGRWIGVEKHARRKAPSRRTLPRRGRRSGARA